MITTQKSPKKIGKTSRFFFFSKILIAVAILLFVVQTVSAKDRFYVGQVWHAAELWLVIGKIDDFDGLVVISVSAYNDEALKKEFAAHLPVSLESFEGSNPVFVRAGALVSDGFEGGYRYWRKEFENGGGGIW